MSVTVKKANGYQSAFTSGTHVAPVVKHYEVTVTAGADAVTALEAGLDGFIIPAGCACISGDMGGTSPTATILYGANNSTPLMTAADPGAAPGVLESTISTGVTPGTASASATLWISTASGASDATGTLLVTVTMIPLATKAKVAGVGV